MHGGTLGMRRMGRTMYIWLRVFGVDPWRFGVAISSLRGYWQGYRRIRPQIHRSMPIVLTPYLHDRSESAGTATGHYFWQDMLVAKRVLLASPARHVDVGSRVDGLITHLLVFRDVDVIDIRPLSHPIPGLRFILDDATSLKSLVDQSIESVSSLHAIEHFGLGRYGDPIDAQGHIRGLQSLQRILAPGGRLYLSLPIGAERVEYNGQRVLSPTLPLDVLTELTLEGFVAIPSDGVPREDMSPRDLVATSGWCGLYEFSRPG
jgi:SAM-dependent methyltransferase